jgi:hypothetical protein
MFRSCRHASFVLPLLTSVIFASPKIDFNTKTFNCGNVLEGKADKLEAVFIVKNTGDSLLKLVNVKPSCGCTVVKYDSLVQPGKTAKIESQVNIKGHSSGPISKFITVTSNAKNEPSVRLTIEATVVSVIECSETYLSLTTADAKSPKTISLASKMANLKVTTVSFKSEANPGTPDWQAEVPLSIKYEWRPTDSIRPDGYRIFKLAVFSPGYDNSVNGRFIIKTNHPDKSELSLQGSIQK